MTSTDTAVVLSGSTEDTEDDDPPMCAHGTERSQGWCAMCEAGLPGIPPDPAWERLNHKRNVANTTEKTNTTPVRYFSFDPQDR